ncbi:MAG: DNA-binding response regulator [Betaproteobacteria bacterium]|nr:MAG: DNA-binding response regulator [Betaproteobacteria bacterium]
MSERLDGMSVLLADDHAMVRMGFRLLLEGLGTCVCAEADSGEAALRAYAEQRPDVAVLDVSMPGMGGLAALERLLAREPAARVLILSAHCDALLPARALKLGALGYLCKRCTPEEFLRAVRTVAAGRRYLDPALAPQVALAQLSGAAHPAEALSDKEFSVFLQLARGRSVNEVARDFHLSPSTVGTHLYHIKQKLNAQNAAELALIAMRAGLIEA